MRRLASVVVCLAAAWSFVAGAVAAKAPGFVQATQVQGKMPVSLGGAWFLYARAEFSGGKSRALPPQLFTASQKDGQVSLHLLDVQMPKSIDEPYKAGNRQPTAWEPTPADVAGLRKQWSKLPPATNKDFRAGDVSYDKVEFMLVSPDKYNEVFSGRDPGIEEALSGSVFALRVVEKYRPLPAPPGQNVAQVMERRTIYVVRSASDGVLEGKQFTGYVAAGPGLPIPISLTGPFKIFRLTSSPGPSREGARSSASERKKH